MSARDYRPGEQAYLVPNRAAAPAAAYSQPKVEIVSYTRSGRAVVRLPDGREIETDSRNIQDEPRQERTTKNMQVRPKLPDGFTEQPLF